MCHVMFLCQAAVMEGMYRKRRLETVASQYQRWRIESRWRIPAAAMEVGNRGGRIIRRPRPSRDFLEVKKAEGMSVRRFREEFSTPQPDPPTLFDDDLVNPFTDRLFDSLNLPYEFPNPKEMGKIRTSSIGNR